MSTKFVIIDSWGKQTLHAGFRDHLPNVSFSGEEFPAYDGNLSHPHGGWCAFQWLSQVTDAVDCIFLRVLSSTGSGGNFRQWMLDALTDLGLTSADYVNMSWGGGSDYPASFKGKFEDAVNGAGCFLAAGNDGIEETMHPQLDLVGLPNVIVVGSVNEAGIRSAWSSTGPKDAQYVECAFFGQGMLTIDPVSGNIRSWNGTSGASPNAGGACHHHGFEGAAIPSQLRAHVLDDWDNDGIPNGINNIDKALIESGGYHHEVGCGVGEGLRQVALKATGRGLSVASAGAGALMVEPSYHDFKRI